MVLLLLIIYLIVCFVLAVNAPNFVKDVEDYGFRVKHLIVMIAFLPTTLLTLAIAVIALFGLFVAKLTVRISESKWLNKRLF